MKVSVAVFGRFWAFYLAQQLQKKNYLHQLVTTYPTYKASEFGIDTDTITSLFYLEILSRSWNKLPSWLKSDRNLQLFWLEWFDRDVTKNLNEDFDIFVGWSGACLWSFRRAKELGALTIVERGSSHIQYQTEILQEEYERWGLKFTATHQGVYQRELQAYEECDRIAIPSLFVKRTFLEKGIPESKLIHVPYGVSLSEFYPVPKEDKTFRVIHCGAISLRKGVQYLLQAFYELNLPEVELWLVGSVDPEIMPFLTKYQSDRIILKGKQPQNTLRWFYSQCSIFCMASIEEGLAMVQPQAMACGLPIIHTTNTGGEDIVRDGIDGFCVPIRDIDALKSRILYFYENPDSLEEMSKNALQQAQTSLSWDDYGEKIISTYKKFIKLS